MRHTIPVFMIVCESTVRDLACDLGIAVAFLCLYPYPGLDDLLSKHISHLFIRDPIVIFSEMIDLDDNASTDHFEVRLPLRSYSFAPICRHHLLLSEIDVLFVQNIQSTNWQTLRFKPPPPNSPIGWRVEFRTMEVQMTDFENAAFAVFIVLLSRAIMSQNLNFYIPISKVRCSPSPFERALLNDGSVGGARTYVLLV